MARVYAGSRRLRNAPASRGRGVGLCFLLLVAVFAAGRPLHGQEENASSVSSQEEGDSHGAAAPAPAVQKRSKPQETRWRFRWDDHPSLQFGPGTRIDFRVRLQADGRASDAPFAGSTFDLTRRRVGIEGRIAGALDYEVDYELDAERPWRDVYVNFRRFAAIRVQAGQFKLPFGLEQNTSPTNLDFVYRALASSHLAPGRDRGVMAHGRLAGGTLRYEAGWFDRDGANARTNNPERVSGGGTIAGRVSLRPFDGAESHLADLHVGAAITASDVPEGFSGMRGRTFLDESFFRPDYAVRGRRWRTGLEARWRPGPFSLKAEYIRVTTERRGQSVEDTDLSPLVASGGYFSGTWLLTGESKGSGPDRPRRPVHRGGPGAIELAGRWETLSFASAASDGIPSSSPRADVILANRDRALTLGINWYPIRGVKLQANVVRESLAVPELGPLPSRPSFWSRVLRLQFTI